MTEGEGASDFVRDVLLEIDDEFLADRIMGIDFKEYDALLTALREFVG